MPQKPNKAGNMQEYVPAGNGDASGEYGYNSGENKGGNKHFQAFKKPENEDKKAESTKQTRYEENVNKLKKINEKQQEIIKKGSENKQKKYVLAMQDGTYKIVDEDFANKYNNSWSFRMNVDGVLQTIETIDDKAINDLLDNLVEEAKIDVDLPSFNNDEDYRQFMTTSIVGKTYILNKIIPSLPLVNGTEDFNDKYNSFGTYDKFKSALMLYEDKLAQYQQKINEFMNPIRIKEGQEYIDKNFKKLENKPTMEEALKLANPHYEEDRSFHINCQRCVYAYELLRRGYDVEALPNKDSYGLAKEWTNQMIYKEEHQIEGKSYPSIRKQVRDIVNKSPNGSRWALNVVWKSRGAHVFIVEKVNNEIKFLDPQNNNANVEEYISRLKASYGVGLRRLDNADFTGSVKKTAKTREKTNE